MLLALRGGGWGSNLQKNSVSGTNDMRSDDNLSNEDVNHSISLMLAQSDSNTDSLRSLISDLTLQLRDADCIMAEIWEVMLLILTHYA